MALGRPSCVAEGDATSGCTVVVVVVATSGAVVLVSEGSDASLEEVVVAKATVASLVVVGSARVVVIEPLLSAPSSSAGETDGVPSVTVDENAEDVEVGSSVMISGSEVTPVSPPCSDAAGLTPSLTAPELVPSYQKNFPEAMATSLTLVAQG